MKLPLDNLNYPIKILLGKSSGSGFLVSNKDSIYLVTARHVIYQQDSVTKEFIPHNDKLKLICQTIFEGKIQARPKIYELSLEIFKSEDNLQYSDSADLVILKLADIIKTDPESTKKQMKTAPGVTLLQEADGSIVHYVLDGARKFDEVEITNDVFVLGYPVSLSSEKMDQLDYDVPLVRKGIVAGKNQKNKTLILDCPVYGGNSGGIVLEMNSPKIHLVGIIVQFVPFLDQWRNLRFPDLYNTSYQNSGYSIALPVDHVYDLIDKIGKNRKSATS